MNDKLRDAVCQRARDHCEYCGLPQSALPLVRFHVDHIIAEQHGGREELANLALCCARCNLSKGPNLSGVDPLTGEIVLLFHPRLDLWGQHFELHGVVIIGLTPTGRATIHVLKMNEERRLQLRRAWRTSYPDSPASS